MKKDKNYSEKKFSLANFSSLLFEFHFSERFRRLSISFFWSVWKCLNQVNKLK